MGQEWAASTPFLFFTDHEPSSAAVTEGRRAEFAAFSAFADPATRSGSPTLNTRRRSARANSSGRNVTGRRTRPYCDSTKRCLHARRSSGAVLVEWRTVSALDEATLAMTVRSDDERIVLAVVRIAGQGRVRLDDCVPDCGSREWRIVMTTEDETFTDVGAHSQSSTTTP